MAERIHYRDRGSFPTWAIGCLGAENLADSTTDPAEVTCPACLNSMAQDVEVALGQVVHAFSDKPRTTKALCGAGQIPGEHQSEDLELINCPLCLAKMRYLSNRP